MKEKKHPEEKSGEKTPEKEPDTVRPATDEEKEDLADIFREVLNPPKKDKKKDKQN
jgi:hypothetical protein